MQPPKRIILGKCPPIAPLLKHALNVGVKQGHPLPLLPQGGDLLCRLAPVGHGNNIQKQRCLCQVAQRVGILGLQVGIGGHGGAHSRQGFPRLGQVLLNLRLTQQANVYRTVKLGSGLQCLKVIDTTAHHQRRAPVALVKLLNGV